MYTAPETLDKNQTPKVFLFVIGWQAKTCCNNGLRPNTEYLKQTLPKYLFEIDNTAPETPDKNPARKGMRCAIG